MLFFSDLQMSWQFDIFMFYQYSADEIEVLIINGKDF